MLIKKLNLFFIFLHSIKISKCDAPDKWQSDFNEVATPTIEKIVNFNESLSFIIYFISIFVVWLILNCIFFYTKPKNSTSFKFIYLNKLETIWTVISAIILFLITIYSCNLLYLMDEIVNSNITSKSIEHPWYWDHNYCICEAKQKNTSKLNYESYILDSFDPTTDKVFFFKVFKNDNELILPIKTHIRLLISEKDDLFYVTMPSQVKIFVYPGTSNELNVYIKEAGIYLGHYIQYTGENHDYIPFFIIGLERNDYNMFLYNQSIK